MLVLTDYAIYAARDRLGRTPISIGKNDMGYVCASESSSYTNLGYSYVRDLGPGEIVQMSADGVRYENGAAMARRDKDIDID